MRRLLAAMFIAAFAGMFAGAADAADYKLLRLGGKLVKWGAPQFGAGATLTYAIASRRMNFPDAINCRGIQPVKRMLAKSGIAIRTFETELAAAFLAWERIANIRFEQVDDPASANIVIGAQIRPRGHAFANVAYEHESGSEIRTISKSLVCFNPQRRWKIGFDGNDKIYDLRFTLMHEIGHAIGLDHEGSGDQIMGFSYHETFRQPQNGDIAGASQLYGPVVGAPVIAAGGVGHGSGAGAAGAGDAPVLSLGRERGARRAD